MSNALAVRVVVMVVVVAVLAIWLHLWWLAVLYAAFWSSLTFLASRRTRRRGQG
jgi:hypothetical protein